MYSNSMIFYGGPIGRSKGFTSQSDLTENLSMKENIIDKLKIRLKDNKIIYFIFSIIFLFFIFFIFYSAP